MQKTKEKKIYNKIPKTFLTWTRNKTRTNTKSTAVAAAAVHIAFVLVPFRNTFEMLPPIYIRISKYKEPFGFEHIFHLAISTNIRVYFTIHVAWLGVFRCASGSSAK